MVELFPICQTKFNQTLELNTKLISFDFDILSFLIKKYIRNNDKILIIGSDKKFVNSLRCNGYSDVNSILYNVFTDRKKKPEQIILAHLTTNTYNVILDRMTNKDNNCILLTQIFNSLNNCGRYFFIGLIPSSAEIIRWFIKSEYASIIRIHLLKPEILCVVFTKLCVPDKKVIELSLGSRIKRISIEEFDLHFSYLSNYALALQNLKKMFLKEEIIIELWNDSPKYYFYICHSSPRSSFRYSINEYKYAAFIVPQGKENEWLFSSSDGRKELLKMTNTHRLVVIHLSRTYLFKSLDDVRKELIPRIIELAPEKFNDFSKLPFLSIGEDCDSKKIIFEGVSDYNGKYSIEDVSINGIIYRRLVFLSSSNVIQSEARLTKDNEIDSDFLSCKHHGMMIFIISLYKKMLTFKNPKQRILLIGLGGGCFASFAQKNMDFNEAFMDLVEIDKEMGKISCHWFGLKITEDTKIKCNIIIEDGIKFIECLSQNIQDLKMKKDCKKYNLVIFDVNSNESQNGLSCPPEPFIEESFLIKVKIIMEDTSLFLLNVVTRNEKIRKKIELRLCFIFESVGFIEVPQDVNVIYFACKTKFIIEKDFTKENLIDRVSDILKKKYLLKNIVNIDDAFKRLNIIK